MDAKTVETLTPWFPGLDIPRVRLVRSGPGAWFVRSVLRQGAMTIAPFVFFGKHAFSPDSPSSLALLAHELKHIEQYHAMGHLRFLWTYTLDRRRAGGYSRDLPLEVDPYALQAEVLRALESRGA